MPVLLRAKGLVWFKGEHDETPAAILCDLPADADSYTGGSVSISWSAPDNGGLAIDGYQVEYSSDGGKSNYLSGEIDVIEQPSHDLLPILEPMGLALEFGQGEGPMIHNPVREAIHAVFLYHAVKAGMDHYSRALAMEEALQPNGAKIVSLAPGIIDTDMQVQLRSADRNKFPEGARFAGFKSEGRLDSPESAGAKIVAYLERADFGAQVIADVRDAA